MRQSTTKLSSDGQSTQQLCTGRYFSRTQGEWRRLRHTAHGFINIGENAGLRVKSCSDAGESEDECGRGVWTVVCALLENALLVLANDKYVPT